MNFKTTELSKLGNETDDPLLAILVQGWLNIGWVRELVQIAKITLLEFKSKFVKNKLFKYLAQLDSWKRLYICNQYKWCSTDSFVAWQQRLVAVSCFVQTAGASAETLNAYNI